VEDEVEVWLPCVDFPGYEVSSLGRVRSLDRDVKFRDSKKSIKGRVLKPCQHRTGYSTVNLPCSTTASGFSPVLIHRLVATAHLQPPLPEKTQVNHINFNRADNRRDNLEWCTCKENMRHSSENGRLGGEANNMSKLTQEQVAHIRSLEISGKYSQPEIARMFGVHKHTIGNILLGHTWAFGRDDVIRLCPNRKRGKNTYAAKLTEDDVKWIKREGSDLSGAELSRKFGVSQPCISMIRSGKSWSHIT